MPSTKHWLLGIDGGGTSCRARLCNSQGGILGEGKSGSANVRLGIQEAFDAIVTAALEAVSNANLTADILSQTYVGLGLAGAISKQCKQKIINYPHPFAEVDVTTDAVTACIGAHSNSDGAILILGTGSAGIIKLNGEFKTLGGWGFPVSDAGSGAQMGLRLTQLTLESAEGLQNKTALTNEIMSQFNHSPQNISLWAATAKPRDYAAFAPTIIHHFQLNDAIATKIINQHIQDVSCFLNRLKEMKADKISLMGGLAPFTSTLLDSQYSELLTPASGDAMDGAIIMASHLFNRTNSCLPL